MRLLHLTPYYRPAYAFGGVVRSVAGLASALVDLGHQVTVLTTDALDHEGRYAGALEETIDGVRVLRRPNVSSWLRGRANLSTPRSMKRTAAELLPAVDVLHAHEFRTVENLLVMPVAQQLGVPIVLSPHGTLNLATGRRSAKMAWDRLLSAGLAQRIDHVVALTDYERAAAEALWMSFGERKTPARFSVIPNGVNLGEFSQLPRGEGFRARYGLADAPTVLYMGRLQARKGIDILIKAFKLADAAQARLLIAGPDEGMLSALKAIAGADPRIVFTGYLAGEDRLAALAASDVFALPATGEGQPMAALEAMAARLPVVLSPGCNMDEVEAAGAGFVAAATAEAFAVELRQLLSDEILRRQMGARGRQLVEEQYSWGSVASRLEAMYLRLL